MAESVACNHYPQIVWRDGGKRLWNPIHRQALKNRPEERVRLRVVEYLIHGEWSKHRISTEEAIDLPQREAKLRTDLICYTQAFKPFLLIECKAENINLSDRTAEQIARYNQRVGAPYLLMTNGRADYWYEQKGNNTVTFVPGPPNEFIFSSSPQTDFSYWQKRGFSGTRASPNLRLWLSDALKKTYLNTETELLRHLSFQSKLSDVELSQYYRIIPREDSRLAITFTATEFGGNRLISILNRNGENKGVLEINLDLLFDDRTPNASIYRSEGTENIDIRSVSPILESVFNLKKMAKSIYKVLIAAIE